VLPDHLGPLRSVTVDTDALQSGLVMIGAAAGVHLLDVNTDTVQHSLPVGDATSKSIRGGFNAAAMAGDRVFATHSEMGLIRWEIDKDTPGTQLFADLTADADAVRSVQVAEAAVWFAANEIVYAHALQDDDKTPPKRYAGNSAIITALHVGNGVVYAGNVDGEIIAWDVSAPDTPRVVRGKTDRPVESIDAIETLGVDQLIIADRSNALLRMTIDDNCTCRYEAGSQIVRRAAIAEDVFVAVNDTRDRLLLWKPNLPDEPISTTVIPHLTGERVQDICLIPRPQKV
jgi:hypothetical protein